MNRSSRTNEFSSKEKDVDAVIDSLLEVQAENGVKSNMRKALFDPVTNERINKFKRAHLESKGVDLSNYGDINCSRCGKCKDKPISNIERGVFVYSEDDLIDDSDEEYICEYCVKIGFDNAYRPEECDCCDACEGCREYQNGECDGCGYSILYNGVPYSQVVGVGSSDSSPSQDADVYEEINSDVGDYDVHLPSGRFTIMNYD